MVLSLRVDPFDGLLTLRIPVGWEVAFTETFCHYLVLMMDYMGGGLIVGSTVGTALSTLQAQGRSKYILVSSPPQEISLLATVAVARYVNVGDTITLRFEQPEFKRLRHDNISELKISICDDIGRILNNNHQSI